MRQVGVVLRREDGTDNAAINLWRRCRHWPYQTYLLSKRDSIKHGAQNCPKSIPDNTDTDRLTGA